MASGLLPMLAMTTLAAVSIGNVLIDVGAELAPIAWLGAAVTIAACLALIALTVKEIRTQRRTPASSFTPSGGHAPGCESQPATAHFDHAA